MNYLFPYELVNKKSNVVIYGSGEVGYDFYQQILTSRYCTIHAWVDRQYEWYQYLGFPVKAPDKINWGKVDAVVVAVTNPENYWKIRQQLECWGMSGDQIIWKDNYRLQETFVAHLDKEKRDEEAKRAKIYNPMDFITKKRLDILIRYMYAQELLMGIENGEGCRLYTKFLEAKGDEEPLDNKVFAFFSDYGQKKGIQAYKDSFQNLIESLKKNNFQKEYFIPLDKHGEIINGAHRLAASLALKIPVWTVDFPLFEGFHFDFSEEWMYRNGFEKKEIDKINSIFAQKLEG